MSVSDLAIGGTLERSNDVCALQFLRKGLVGQGVPAKFAVSETDERGRRAFCHATRHDGVAAVNVDFFDVVRDILDDVGSRAVQAADRQEIAS